MKKPIHCFYNMDTNAVELTYNDGSVLTIDCEEVENAYDVTNGQMADLDWLLYNAPMEYASPAVRGNGELPERSCAPRNRRLIICRCIVDCDTPVCLYLIQHRFSVSK